MTRPSMLQRRNARRRRPRPVILWPHVLGFLLAVVPVLAMVARTQHAAAPCIPSSVTSCR